jgi:hypothetical protein
VKLPTPAPQYDPGNEAQFRRLLAVADDANQKRRSDVVIKENKLILTSPDGAQWSGTISNAGVVTWAAL